MLAIHVSFCTFLALHTEESLKLTVAQRKVLFWLLLGYTGYYLCRTFFAVIKPALLDEFGPLGLNTDILGTIASAGIAAYVVGKLVNGTLADLKGGKWMLLAGMLGSIVCTVVLGFSAGIFMLGIFWVLNRYVQSAGWGALVKVAGQWFHYRQYGRAMAILSLSFLFGDSLIRFVLGSLMEWGLGWRAISLVAAGGLLLIAGLIGFYLKPFPQGPAETAPLSQLIQAEASAAVTPVPTWQQLLKTYLGNVLFWVILLLSFGLTGLRETFNEWLNTYLKQTSQLTTGQAGMWSALFPFVGGISCLVFGYLSDSHAGWSRARILWVTQLALASVMLAWYWAGSDSPLAYRLVLASLAAFLLIGPYTFLAGAIALEWGGKSSSSTAAGLIDSFGYIGGMLMVKAAGSLASGGDWNQVLLLMALLALAGSGAALVFVYQSRSASTHAPTA